MVHSSELVHLAPPNSFCQQRALGARLGPHSPGASGAMWTGSMASVSRPSTGLRRGGQAREPSPGHVGGVGGPSQVFVLTGGQTCATHGRRVVRKSGVSPVPQCNSSRSFRRPCVPHSCACEASCVRAATCSGRLVGGLTTDGGRAPHMLPHMSENAAAAFDLDNGAPSPER